MMDFTSSFHTLTGHPPFPWQERLYCEYFEKGHVPSACCLPTGLGKTSVIAVWLIALANGKNLPRRLIYVVNRRTVVDQTTDEIVRYQQAIKDDRGLSAFRERFEQLRISTLRGQFADNGDWCEDPSIPAVICGTVDMIGSRLLFSGYGLGRNKRPLHAGFLGQDALLIHDEAHLEPAFQRLIETIEGQQENQEPPVPWPKLRVMELTATTKSQEPFTLGEDDYANGIVDQRMNATKRLQLKVLSGAKKPAKELIEKSLSFNGKELAVLIFAQSVEAVLEIRSALEKAKVPQKNVRTLTGTMRGKERDELAEDKTFARFLPKPPDDATEGAVYLVCTSAGEVGVNISADHLICDLTTFESMAQRFGRVNRFGVDRSGKKVEDCEVHVFHPRPDDWDDKHPLTIPRQRTLELLRELERKGSVSPKALSDLSAAARSAAFAPIPTILPATDMLFDAWALTTITGKLPGRPLVEPYLHGLSEYQPPVTQVAWRAEVERLQPVYRSDVERNERWPSDRKELSELASKLLDDYPLKPLELLSDRTSRVRDEIDTLANRYSASPVWIIDADGTVTIHQLDELTVTEKRDGRSVYRVNTDGCVILLPPYVGGLKNGLLDGAANMPPEGSLDVADEIRFLTADLQPLLARIRSDDRDDERARDMQLIRAVPLPSSGIDDETEAQFWYWFTRRNTGEVKSRKPVLLGGHVSDVEKRLREILSGLSLGESLDNCLKIAARFHDDGKKRLIFQSILGNRNAPNIWWAKSGRRSGIRLEEKYRHEFGSLYELPAAAELDITEDERELVLHLIAAHHGRARPHFPSDEVFDPSQPQPASDELAMTVPQRFGRLQRRFGRWGLAYLESLLRAADWSASAHPSQEIEETV